MVEQHLLHVLRNPSHPLGALLNRFSNLFHASFDYSKRFKRKSFTSPRRRRRHSQRRLSRSRSSRSGMSDTSAPTYSSDRYETETTRSDVVAHGHRNSFLSRIFHSLTYDVRSPLGTGTSIGTGTTHDHDSGSTATSGHSNLLARSETESVHSTLTRSTSTAAHETRSTKSVPTTQRNRNGSFYHKSKHKRSLSSDSGLTQTPLPPPPSSVFFVPDDMRWSQRHAQELLVRAIKDVNAFQERFLMLIYQLFPRVNTHVYRLSSRSALHEAMFDMLSPTLTTLFQKANEREDREFHFTVSAMRDIVTLKSVGVRVWFIIVSYACTGHYCATSRSSHVRTSHFFRVRGGGHPPQMNGTEIAMRTAKARAKKTH